MGEGKTILTNQNTVPRGKLWYVMGSVNFKCVCPWFFYPQNRDFSANFNSTPPVRYLAFFRNFLIRLRVRVYILWFGYTGNLNLKMLYINIYMQRNQVPHHLNLGNSVPSILNLLIESFSTIYGFIYVSLISYWGQDGCLAGNPGSIQL